MRKYPMTFVETVFHKHQEADILIISDCRFPNECEYIQAHGGL